MSKVKIFRPEDFDKDKKSKRWIRWAVAAAVVVVAGGMWYFAARDNGGSQQTGEPPVAVATADSVKDDTSAEGAAMQESGEAEPNSIPQTGNAGQPAEAEPAAPANDKPTTAADKQPAAATATPTGDIEDTAMSVIRGNYGNGNTRKQNLGDKYQTIQNRVNQLKREGAF